MEYLAVLLALFISRILSAVIRPHDLTNGRFNDADLSELLTKMEKVQESGHHRVRDTHFKNHGRKYRKDLTEKLLIALSNLHDKPASDESSSEPDGTWIASQSSEMQSDIESRHSARTKDGEVVLRRTRKHVRQDDAQRGFTRSFRSCFRPGSIGGGNGLCDERTSTQPVKHTGMRELYEFLSNWNNFGDADQN